MTEPSFENLDLIKPLLRVLKAENYSTPTPIQRQAIPLMLNGKDVLGIAQTGTGKTAAFGLPILQILSKIETRPVTKSTRALIPVPYTHLTLPPTPSRDLPGDHPTFKTNQANSSRGAHGSH